MSDTEVVEEVEVAAGGSGDISIEDSIKVVLRNALVHNGLARGLREASKALSRRQAHMAVLCDSVTEAGLIRLIEALCHENEKKVPLVKVSDPKKLGEWAGLCQLDREGNARKVVGCSVVVITDWGVNSQEAQVLLEHFASQ